MRVRTVAILQARMGSSRLPGKVLLGLGEDSVLGSVVRRAQAATEVDEVVVATSLAASDSAIVEECVRLGVRCYRGSEDDVLDRFAFAARAEKADVVVRVTADCPLISPKVVDAVVATRRRCGADYASNTLERTFPVGLDVECFSVDALESAAREADIDSEREHVTPFIYNRPKRFSLASTSASENHSSMRLTLDRHEDLTFLRGLVERHPEVLDPSFPWMHVVSAVHDCEELRGLQVDAREAARDDLRDASVK